MFTKISEFERSLFLSLVLMTIVYGILISYSLLLQSSFLPFLLHYAVVTYFAYAIMAYVYYAFKYGKNTVVSGADLLKDSSKVIENIPMFLLARSLAILFLGAGFLWH